MSYYSMPKNPFGVWSSDCHVQSMSTVQSRKLTPSSLKRMEPVFDLDLFDAYRVAVLLSGSTRITEEVVTQAIESVDPNVFTSDTLLEGTIRAATEGAPSSENAGFAPDEAEFLSLELHEVAQLPAIVRQPLVLRVLLSMSRDSSARLLGLEADAVDGMTGLAAQILAQSSSATNEAVN